MSIPGTRRCSIDAVDPAAAKQMEIAHREAVSTAMAVGLRKIVVPLDGSELAETALPPAQALAARVGASLLLLTTRWPRCDASVPRRYLEERRAELETEPDVVVILDRDAADAITLATLEPGVLVCMATHGRSGVGQAVLGSVAEAVVRADGPTLLVGPENRLTQIRDAPLMLVGLDGSEAASGVLPHAAALTRAIGGSARLVEVVRPTDVKATTRMRRREAEALEVSMHALEALGVEAEYDIVEGFDPADTLAELAAALPATFLAVGTHGHTGLRRVALGSVAARAVHRCPCPVLVSRPI